MFHFVLSLLLLGALTACGYTEAFNPCMENQSPLSEMEIDKPDAVEIPVRISSTILVNPEFDGYSGATQNLKPKEICTPHGYQELINKTLQLFSSIDTFNIKFKYLGLFDEKFTGLGDGMPADGTLYVMLNNPSINPMAGAAGVGGPVGPWGPPHTHMNRTDSMPTSYPGGYLVTGPDHSASVVVHELGHALGLSHIPSPSSFMGYEGRVIDPLLDGYYFTLSQQERADLTAAFPTPSAKMYKISGVVKANIPCEFNVCRSIVSGPAIVHAVNVVNGQTFTALARYSPGVQGKFQYDLNIPEPGEYKLLTVVMRMGEKSIVDHETSWYVDSDTYTNDPDEATSLTLSDADPTHTDIDLVLSDVPATSYISTVRTGVDAYDPDTKINHQKPYHADIRSSDVLPLYLSPGETTRNKTELAMGCEEFIPPLKSCEPLEDIHIFGSNPDVVISDVTSHASDYTPSSTIYMFRITASANAVPGDRLVVAKAGGKYLARLIGINIQPNAKKPTFVAGAIKQILDGTFDTSTIDPTYWK